MKALFVLGLAAGLIAAGCAADTNHSNGVYVLIDAGENHSLDPGYARQVILYLLQTLTPADTLAAASIGSAGFSDRDIIAAMTFDQRPSIANSQKRVFRDRFERFLQETADIPHADLSGGILQAIETLNQTAPDRKTILVLSDLKKGPTRAAAGEVSFQMSGFTVVVLKTENWQIDPQDTNPQLLRAENLCRKVEGGGGRCRIIDDLLQLEEILN